MTQSVRSVAIVGDDGLRHADDDGSRDLRDLRDVVEANGGTLVEIDGVDAISESATDADTVDSDAIDSDAIDSDAIDSDAIDSDAIDSDAIDSDAIDADAIVAVGDRALSESARRGRASPVLPIGTGRFSVPRPSAADAIRQLLAGRASVRDHPLLSVSVGDDAAGRALFDVTLTTAEAARISEYGVSFPGGRSSTFRGDAVVVATPIGSGGYAAAGGGPLVEPGAGLSVVPVAPFTIRKRTWVAPGRVTLSVERDEEPVSLVLDGRPVGQVAPEEPIHVAEADRVDLLSVPATGHGEW